jgi:hypothetical protein
MAVSLFALLIAGIAFAFAIYGRPRFALGTVLAGPVLMLVLWAFLLVTMVLTPCEPPRTAAQCPYGLGMVALGAAMAALAWVGAAGLGWLLGWSVRRISQTSDRNRGNAR